MTFKLKDRTLLNADIISPERPYAVFSDELTQSAVENIAVELNHGSKVLHILGSYHGVTNFEQVGKMVIELKDAYADYSYARYEIERRERSKS
jgi:hypothetical protein